MLLRLLSAVKAKHDHAVVSLKDEGTIGASIRTLGIPVYTLGLRSGRPNPIRAWAIRSLACRLQPHLIQGWMYHGNLMASLAASASTEPVPVIWGVHMSLGRMGDWDWRTQAVIRLGAYFSNRAAATVYVSNISARQHEAVGYRSDRSLVIPNGIDCRMFVPNGAAGAEVRAELGLPCDSTLVGLVSRYHPMKDHAGFLRAVALLAGAHPEVYFLLIGKGLQERSEIRALLQELRLHERVLCLGERADMPRLMAALDIYCSSSAWGEAFSIALGEAMACGVPCVVTDVGDSAYIVADTGLSVPPNSPPALAQGLGRLLEAGPERRHQLGIAARQRVEAEFSLAEIARRYESLYEEQLAGG